MPNSKEIGDADTAKYHVEIKHGQGTVIGNNAQVEQHFYNSSDDPDKLEEQGIQFLKIRSYDQAIEALRSASKANASSYKANFYLSLALLKGRRPKIMSRTEVEEIDRLLGAAFLIDDSHATIGFFRALLRVDYYLENGIEYYPAPSVEQILAETQFKGSDVEELHFLLQQLPYLDNWLYVELIKVIQ